jgi:hypothetical protein
MHQAPGLLQGIQSMQQRQNKPRGRIQKLIGFILGVAHVAIFLIRHCAFSFVFFTLTPAQTPDKVLAVRWPAIFSIFTSSARRYAHDLTFEFRASARQHQ